MDMSLFTTAYYIISGWLVIYSTYLSLRWYGYIMATIFMHFH